ncbi:MAG: hypothetical protein ACQEP7_06275 [bacterium]
MVEQDADAAGDSRPGSGDRDEQLDRENWIDILPPEFEEGESPLIVTWGRFWGNQEDIAVAFYLVGSPLESKIPTLRLAVFGSPENLQNYNPRMAHREFERRIINFNVSDTPVPTVTLNEVHDQLQGYFEAEDKQEALLDYVEESSESEAEEWFDELLDEIFQDGNYTYQIRLLLTSSEKLQKRKTQPTVADKEVEGKVVRVNFVTKPSTGIPAPRLQEGMQAYIRIVGEAVEKLPDEMRDPDKKNISRPLIGWVHKIDNNPELPADFDGEPENYQAVTVELSPGVYGRGLVFKDDMIKIKQQKQQEEILTEEIIRIIGLIFLLILILVLIIFIG